MNQNQLLKKGKEILKQEKIQEADVKARKLLEFVLKQSREEFIKNSFEEVSKNKEQEYIEKLNEIIKGKPVQYITNYQEFMGLDFYVNENVLIPQPDTETLVEETIKLIQNIKEKKLNKQPLQILDLCTGSGAIAISIAKYLQKGLNNKKLESEIQQNQIKIDNNQNIGDIIVASDISNKALEIAKRNAIQNQVKGIQLIQSDMFSKLINYKFDIIVSNPPYIESDVIQTLDKEVQQEPKIALDGGKDGLDIYKTIFAEASSYLKPNGYVLLEIGYNQGEKLLNLCQQLKSKNKCELEIITKKPIKDLGGNDRVVILKKKV